MADEFGGATAYGGGADDFDLAGEDDQEMEDIQQKTRDGLLFCIDCRKQMWIPDAQGDIPFLMALKCAKIMLQNKIINSENDRIGIILFGSRERQNSIEAEGIYELQKLDTPDKSRILQLQDMLITSNGKTPQEKFEETIGAGSGPIKISDLLWAATNALNDDSQKDLAFRRIYMFSNDENPLRSSAGASSFGPVDERAERKNILDRISNLKNAKFWTDFFPVSHPFDKRVFWKICTIAEDEEDDFSSQYSSASSSSLAGSSLSSASSSSSSGAAPAGQTASSLLQELIKDVKSKSHVKRALRRTYLRFANASEEKSDYVMGVVMYSMISKAKKPTGISLDTTTKLALISRTSHRVVSSSSSDDAIAAAAGGDAAFGSSSAASASAAIVEKEAIKYKYSFGGETLIFEPSEVSKIKTFTSTPEPPLPYCQPGFTILGFKPLECLKYKHNIRSSNFIYPDAQDSIVSGSFSPFVALHTKMIEMRRFALCRFVSRPTSAPVFVALIAQEPQEDEPPTLFPHGMQVIYLPYADDIRDLKIEEAPETYVPGTMQRLAAEQMIESLTAKEFDCRTYFNPALSNFYNILTIKALIDPVTQQERDDIKAENKFRDDLLPDDQAFAAASHEISNFMSTVGLEASSGAASSKPTATKRKAAGDSTATSSKRAAVKKEEDGSIEAVKKEEGAAEGEEDGGYDWVDLAKKGKLEKLTMDDLKVYLRAYGLKVGGKKQELVDRVRDDLTERKLI